METISFCVVCYQPLNGMSNLHGVQKFFTRICREKVSFVQKGPVAVRLCLNAQMNLWLSFPYFLDDVSDVWYRTTQHNRAVARFVKICRRKKKTVLRGVKEVMWIEFYMGDVHRIVLSNCEFLENRRNESHIFLIGAAKLTFGRTF